MTALLTRATALGADHAWEWDEASGNVLDRIGSNNLTPTGTPVYQQADQNGLLSAVEFDGSTEYFDSTTNSFNGLAAYTLELLINVQNAGALARVFDERDASDDGVQVVLATSETVAAFHNAVSVQSTATVTNGNWYHIHQTWDGTTLRLYVDGNLEASGAVATAVSTTIAGRFGGRAFTSFANPFDGLVSFAAVYPTELDQAEVDSLVAAALGGSSTLRRVLLQSRLDRIRPKQRRRDDADDAQ